MKLLSETELTLAIINGDSALGFGITYNLKKGDNRPCCIETSEGWFQIDKSKEYPFDKDYFEKVNKHISERKLIFSEAAF